jgi:carbamoyltransferase
MLFFGMTIGHDASLAIADSDGKVLFAAGEERFSRLKGHLGSPFLAFEYAVKSLGLSQRELEQSIVTIGTVFTEQTRWFLSMLVDRSHQKNYDIFNTGLPPGLLRSLVKEAEIQNLTSEELVANAFGFSPKQVFFLNHHDCHASSAFWPARVEKSAVITLDGSGDGECGTISLMNRQAGKVKVYRIPERYSLGHLYSEVTKRYGFKESRHEGKITGLAAYSENSTSSKLLENLLVCKQGRLKFGIRYLLDPRFRDRLEFWKPINHRKAFSSAVSRMESKTESYPDLARGVQSFLESTVNQLLRGSNVLSEVDSISVAGGVFSNVSLNRSIRSSFPNHNFYVFPNMGDGGLAIGSVWEYMRINGQQIALECMTDMYCGGKSDNTSNVVTRTPATSESIASLILEEKIIGIIHREMEFGPRALCHRSIIASPRKREINKTLNERLNRTEFMPFAPVVRDVDFAKVFETGVADRLGNNSSYTQNFRFMTETCLVRDYWVDKIPAVVHRDQTARPQILSREDNPLIYDALGILAEQENLPVLINTSFNAHEEPIIFDEEQGIDELSNERVDVLVSESFFITLNE